MLVGDWDCMYVLSVLCKVPAVYVCIKRWLIVVD